MMICAVDPEIELHLLEHRNVSALEELKMGYQAFRGEWIYHGEAGAFIRASLERFDRQQGFWAGVWMRKELAGVVGLNGLDTWTKSANIDYMLGTAFRGQGIMTRSVKALVRYAFEALKLNRIEIRVDKENFKDCAIPERLGFRKEGVLRDKLFYGTEFGDMIVYATLAKEWERAVHP